MNSQRSVWLSPPLAADGSQWSSPLFVSRFLSCDSSRSNIFISFWLDYAKGLSPGHVTWVSRSTLRKLDAAHCCRSPAVYGLHAEGEQTEERRRQKERWPRSLQLFLKGDSLKRSAHLHRYVRLIVWRQVGEMCYHKHSHLFFYSF